jgi:hypothetical protein
MQAASFKDRWQRSHAEMQNLIARQAREKETMQTYAVQVRWLQHSNGSGLSFTPVAQISACVSGAWLAPQQQADTVLELEQYGQQHTHSAVIIIILPFHVQCVLSKICLEHSGSGLSSSCSNGVLFHWLLTWRCSCCFLQKFAQSLLEVADNLESAQRAVPAAVLQPGAEVSAEKALGFLKALLEGVQATERVLLKVMLQSKQQQHD